MKNKIGLMGNDISAVCRPEATELNLKVRERERAKQQIEHPSFNFGDVRQFFKFSKTIKYHKSDAAMM